MLFCHLFIVVVVFSSFFFRAVNVPQLRIVNGKLVVNEDTLAVPAAGTLEPLPDQILLNDRDRYTTAASFGRRLPPDKWNALDTERFYEVWNKWKMNLRMDNARIPAFYS